MGRTYNVITNNVMIALLCEELHGEASHVSDGVCAALFTSGGTDTEENPSLLADAIEEFGGGQGRDVVGDFEFTLSTRSFSMDNSNEFSVPQVSWLTGRKIH